MPKTKKQPPKPLIGSFALGYYPVKIAYYLGVPAKQLSAAARKRWGVLLEPPGAPTCGMNYDCGGLQLIWLEKTPTNFEEREFLNHEMLHAVNGAADYVGVRRGQDGAGEEFFAYATGAITKRIGRAIDRHRA